MIEAKTESRSIEQVLSADPFGKDKLHRTIVAGHKDNFHALIKSVKENGISLDNKDYLHWSVHYGRYGFISSLIVHGCKPYISVGNEPSILDHAIKEKDARLLIEIINASQRCSFVTNSPFFDDKRILVKPFSKMTGIEKIIAIIMIVKMSFSEISFYVTEINPVIAYSLYTGVSLGDLSKETEHEHVRNLILKSV